jgi:hypothetical protein
MCGLCRRTLLAGERFRHWHEQDRIGTRPVCMLCEAQAKRTGWERAPTEIQREGAVAGRWTVRLVA